MTVLHTIFMLSGGRPIRGAGGGGVGVAGGGWPLCWWLWGLFPDKGALNGVILINFMKEALSSNERELKLNVKVINGKHHGGELFGRVSTALSWRLTFIICKIYGESFLKS